MAKPKRMSEMFASSSSEKDTDHTTTMRTVATTTTTTTTPPPPPYSSEGPTLPILSAAAEEHVQSANLKLNLNAKEQKSGSTTGKGKKRKAPKSDAGAGASKPAQATPVATIHTSLYKPWRLLPVELLGVCEREGRLRMTKNGDGSGNGNGNVVPVVFSKNQNVRAGINRLKGCLGACGMGEMRGEVAVAEAEALGQEDCVVVVSGQGEGTAKVVGVVDMVRRIVAPGGQRESGKQDGGEKSGEMEMEGEVETWCMYTMLSSVEVERRVKRKGKHAPGEGGQTETAAQKEKETSESMHVDGAEGAAKEEKDMRIVPVLTVWMTRKTIPAFKHAFGEQTFRVQKMAQEHD